MIAPVIFLFILMISLIIYLTKTTEYQAKYYHSQLLPHALLNDMVFFQKSIIENNTANAQQYFAYQTNYLKKILETENKLVSLITEEIQQTEDFVYYYNLVNNSDFKIQFDVNNKKNKAFYVPSLLFQPFVENIFKYEKNKKNNQRQVGHLIFFVFFFTIWRPGWCPKLACCCRRSRCGHRAAAAAAAAAAQRCPAVRQPRARARSLSGRP